ncbi:MAG: hypothetical protein KDB53_11395, partial [Planctomycetes bacterium]|nr:hypothetical protein [Planctomycetota bacterium]
MRVFFLSSICWWLASTGLAQSQFELDVGSRLVSGVYENAPYSLRIRAPEGFRIQGRAESGFDDPYRVATLVYKLMPVIVCAVAVQPSNVEAWIENQRQIELDSAKGGEPEDIEMEVGGTLRKGLCIRYETGMIST